MLHEIAIVQRVHRSQVPASLQKMKGRALIRSLNPTRIEFGNEKTDVAEHPEVFDHVGLVFNEPTWQAGLLFN